MKKLILFGVLLLIFSGILYAQQVKQPDSITIPDFAIPTGVGGGGVFGAIITYLVLYFKNKKTEESLLLEKMGEIIEKIDETRISAERIADCLMALRDSHKAKYPGEVIPSPK